MGRTSALLRATFLIGLYCLLTAHGPTARTAGMALQPAGDIALHEGPEATTTIYVADASRPGLWSTRVGRAQVQSMKDLQPVPWADGVKRPVSLDANATTLVVLDAEGPRVLAFDLAQPTSGAREMMAGPPLRQPASVAIGANGTIAIADPGAHAVVFVSAKGEIWTDPSLQRPRQVEWDLEGSLYVLDDDDGLVTIETPSPSSRAVSRYQDAKAKGPSRLLPRDAEAFTVHRGILYLGLASGLQVSVPVTRAVLEVPPPLGRRRLVRVAASPRHMAGLDPSGVVVTAERPMPVGVRITPQKDNPGAPTRSVLDLATYLREHRMLATRLAQRDDGDKSYYDLLVRHGVLPAAAAAPDAALADTTTQLFCVINPARCGSSGDPAAAFAQVKDDEDVVVPQIALESSVTSSEVKLEGGKSARAYIDERVPDAKQREAISSADLVRLNPGRENSFELELQRRNFVSPRPLGRPLGAGTVVQLTAAGEEQVLGSIGSDCPDDIKLADSPSRLPLLMRLTSLETLPPDVRGTATSQTHFADVMIGSVTREQLSFTALKRCRPPKTRANAYVIVEALRADKVRYRLVKRPLTVLREEDWKELPGPLYIAYRPAPIDGLEYELNPKAVDVAKYRNETQTDVQARLWDRQEGSLMLPILTWRFDALLPAGEYYDKSTSFNKLREKHAQVMNVSSHESLRVAARSMPVSPIGANSSSVDPTEDEIKAGIKKAHDELTSAIGYTPELAAGTEGAIVGIAEKLESVNRDHPSFIEDGRSAWWETLDDSTAQAHQPPNGAAAAAALTLARLSEDEHGTHVAGIIGARASSVAPGLLPSANLLLIPTNTANSLNAGIELARQSSLGVKVFNLSFIFESGQFDGPLLDDLQRMMRTDWKDKLLFVVAAGNGGKDLNTDTPPAPVSWISTTSNILSVGATRADGTDLLGHHTDPGEAAHAGSNFGSKFVHLVAPGERVHSLGKDGYAFACGTSQAAPQVSAAAAMLVAQDVRHPLEIKARLMYTADWLPQYTDRVQAGRLNVKRAVRHPSLNLVQMFSDGKWFSLKPTLNSHVVVTSGRLFKSNGMSEPVFNKKFDFARVLSLIHLQGSQFRMFALTASNDFVSVIGDLDTTTRIGCASLREFDASDMPMTMATPGAMQRCTPGIAVSQIKEYIAQTGSALNVVF